MKTVSIPGVGDVDFPDEMTDDAISTAIQRDILPKQQPVDIGDPSLGPEWSALMENPEMRAIAERSQMGRSPLPRQPTAEEAARPSFDTGYQQPVHNLLNPPAPGPAEFPGMKDVPAGMPGGPNGQRVSVPPNPRFQDQPAPVAPQLASERERTLNQYAQDLPLSSEEFNVAAAKGAAGATPGIPEPQLSTREEATGGQYLGAMVPGVAAMATGAGVPAAMAAYGMEESLKRGGLDPNTNAPVHPVEMAVQGAIGGLLGTKAGQSIPGIIAGFGGLGAVQSTVAEIARQKQATGEVSLEQANNPEFLKSIAVSLIQGLLMGPMAMGHGGEPAADPLETVSRPGENSDYRTPPEPGRQPITPEMADAHAALPPAPEGGAARQSIEAPQEAPAAAPPEPIVPRDRGLFDAAPTPDDMQGRQWAAGTEAQTRLREAEAAREPIAQAHDDAVQASVEAENALRSRFPEDGVSPKYPAERDLQRALAAKHQDAEAALADARAKLDEANAARDEAQQAAQRAQPSTLPDIPMNRLQGRQEAIRAMQEAGLPPEHIQRATQAMDLRPEVYELGSKAVDLSPEVLRQLGVGGPDVSRETPALRHEVSAPKISYETVDFGEGSPLQAKFPEFQAMPYEQKAEASKQLSGLTRRIATQVLGVTGRESEGPGFWEDYPIRPNAQLDANTTYEKAAAYADLVGYLHQQDAVFMMREHPDGQKLGVKLAFEGGRPDEAKLSRFWGELRKAAPDLAIGGMSTPEGIIIARDEPSSQREAFRAKYSEAIRSALERSGLRAQADFANIDWELRQSGGWKDGNNGRAYLERLQQSLGPEIGDRVDRLYRPAVESAVGRIVAGKQPEPAAAGRGPLLQEHDAAHGRGERNGSGELQRRFGIEPASLEANTPEAAKSVYTALGSKIEDRNTGPELKIYPLADVPPEKLQAWLRDSGWNYKIFGPDQETGKFVPPNFREFSYDNKHVWIFSPWTEHGSFRDTEYTRIWRVTHEVAHGQTNDQLTQRYGGVGRRQGALGRATKFNGRDVPALSLADALRAVEWEHDTFQRQREILEKDFGIKITEEAFRKENAINMSDAVYRVLTGDFSNPGDNGLVPRAMPPDQLLARAKDILRAQAKDLGIDTAETFESGARLQDQSQGEIKGAFIPSTAEKNGMIYLVKGKADLSTVLHEYLGHGLEEKVLRAPENAALLAEAENLITKDIGAEAIKNGWTVEAKEWFARKVERYFYEGNTDVPSLKPLFEKIRAYMQKVYAAVVGGPMGKSITADERAFFDKVFGKGEKPLMQKAKAPSEEGAPQAARGETKKAKPTPESRPTLSTRESEAFGSKPVSVRAEDKSTAPKSQVPGERSLPKTLEAAGIEGGTDRGYEVKHLDESAKAAMAEIDAKGAEVVQHDILGRPKFDPQDMPRAIALMRRWQHEADSLPPGPAKDTALAKTVQMASEMSRRATEAGQFNAMVRILEKLSPDGVVYYAQKQLDKLNASRGPKREVKLKPEAAKALREAAKELKASQDLAEDAAPLAKAAEKIEKGQALDASDLQDLAEFRRRLAAHLGEAPPERPKGVLRGATPKPTAPAAKGPKPTVEAAEALLAKREEAALARLRARGLSPTKALLQSTRTLTEEDVSDLADVFASRLAARKASVSAVRQNFTESFGSDITPFLDDIAQKGARRLQEARRERARMTDLSKRVDEILAPLLKGAPAEINQAEQLRATFDAVKELTGDAKREASWDLQETLNAMVPAGAGKQAAAILAIAQLLNPKTALRNIVGNELFHAAERASKWVAANGIDWPRSVLTGTDRTITFRTGGQGDYWKSLMTGTEAALRGVNPEGLESKYDLSGSSFQSRKNPFYWAERALGVTMRATDYAAYKRAFGETMGELAEMAADRRKMQGSQRETFINKWIDDAGPEVREIAEAYGKYATFQDHTALAMGAAGLKNFLNAGKDFGMGNFIINYPKTPANILMRAIEYSPAGILRSVGMLWKGWRTGIPVDVRELEMSLGRVLVGGMGGGLAWYLAKNGALSGQAEKDKDVRTFKKEQTGESNYQVNVSAIGRWLVSGLKKDQLNKRDGDKLISYDWAQPLAINAAMTATAVRALSDKRKPIEGMAATAEAGLEGATKTLEEQPLLSGLEKLFNSDKSIPGRLMDILEGVPASFSPTLLNQIRQIKDNKARSADAPTAAGRMINKVMYRLPFLSEKLPVIYKTLGKSEPREAYQNGNNNLFNVFLNPAFVAKYHVDPGIAVILSPYEKEERKNQFPQALTKRDLKYSQHGEQKVYSMSGEELSELQRRLAQETYRRFESMHIERLKDASPERQEKILAHGVNDSWNKIRKEFLHEKGIHAK